MTRTANTDIAVGKKRSKFQRELDLVLTAKWYAQGKPQAVIAREIGVSPAQISYDIAEIKKRWMTEQVHAFDERMMYTLAKLDMAESEAWAAWESSKQDKVVSTTEKTEGDKSSTKAQLRKEKQYGDVAYYNAAMDVIKERNKIMGMYAPERLEATVTTHSTNLHISSEIDLSGMTMDEIQTAIRVSESQMAALNSVGTPLIIESSFTPLVTLQDRPALPLQADEHHPD